MDDGLQLAVGKDTGPEFNELATVRGIAIQDYAKLEHALCRLLAVFGKMSIPTAGIIFYKITSANVRDAILGKLLKCNFGDTYSTFWKSLSYIIGQVSLKRNDVVHWIAASTNLDGKGESAQLVPGNVFGGLPQATMSPSDLVDFCNRCRFLFHACWQFMVFLTPQTAQTLSEATRRTLHEIFQQPIAYPCPDTHPLSPNYKEPEIPPPPSQG